MVRGRGIALRLSVLLIAGGGFTVAIVLGYNYFFARRLLVREVERRALHEVQAAANHVDTVLRSTEEIPNYLSGLLTDQHYGETELWRLLQTEIEQRPEVYGTTIAFEPYAFDDSRRYFAPYFFRRGSNEIEFTLLGNDDYRYFYLDWYQIPKELGQGVWSEPYNDIGGGNVLMATYSAPFYRSIAGEQRFTGIVTADIALQWLQAYVSSIQISATGYTFLISETGRLITHPRSDFVMNETIFSLAAAQEDAQLREIGRTMIRGQPGIAQTRSLLEGKESWLVYAPVPSTGWVLAAVFPRDEMLAPVWRMTQVQLLLAAAGGLVFLAVIIGLARSITRPLTALAQVSEKVARGNLDAALPRVRHRDEVASLTAAFGRMQHDLKQYLKEHDELLAIRHELDVARRIQESILPRIFPPFPERHDFEIYADMLPAQEVGGDFYDLFLVDDRRLGFAIGDVSGKGVPAALFMAVTRTLLRSTAMTGAGAGDCLQRVNTLLCADNQADMFVTLFYGILHTDTGELEYSNGGHLHPYILHRGSAVETLAGTGGMFVGAIETARYTTRSIKLDGADSIFLYTDGVTEAMNTRGDLFSDGRLRTVLDQINGARPEDVVRRVIEEVRRYAQQAPQSDDITLMTVRYLTP
jgi:sigma-B regulation protein RsbU (phosphoserine phosphatase)